MSSFAFSLTLFFYRDIIAIIVIKKICNYIYNKNYNKIYHEVYNKTRNNDVNKLNIKNIIILFLFLLLIKHIFFIYIFEYV